MARLTKNMNLEPVIEAAQRWIQSCLVNDGSVFSNEGLWTPENVAQVRSAFVEHPDEGKDDFLTKLKGQMKTASPPAQRIMAEMVWALLLFPSNISISTKRRQVSDVWSISGQSLSQEAPMLSDEILAGIGSGGTGYNTLRWREMVYLISLVGDLKQRPRSERQELISQYDAFIEWITHVPQEGERQFRHMLRFFCFPERVERMSTNRDRKAVLAGFGVAPEKESKNWSDRQLDDALLTLRSELQQANPSMTLDFYEEPLQDRWRKSKKEPKVNKGLAAISTQNQSVAFSVQDCEVFARYPKSVSWDDVTNSDKELFKSIRERLKKLAELVAAKNGGATVFKTATSLTTPNGRSPRDIWCCLYPVNVSNKSYGLQVALLISEFGAEVCFCLGAGTSQVKDAEDRAKLEAELNATRERLAIIPSELVASIEEGFKRKWYFQRSWRSKPNVSDFSSLDEWIKYASSPQGSGASVSIYLSPTELQESGPEVVQLFEEALDSFWKLLAYAYDMTLQDRVSVIESSAFGSDSAASAVEFNAAVLLQALADIQLTGFRIEREFLTRFASSLAAKPFLILTGNSGTGKTKLAELFVHWLCRNSKENIALVPVGADWTDNRNVLGFVNHLRSTSINEAGTEFELPIYQTTRILDLLLVASRKENERKPYFLILDEMNLSHVERYFADFLSALESKDRSLLLHREGHLLPRTTTGHCDVPENLVLPRNLFVIGTVNVDETTYMFSPKVLDRANVLEFRVSLDAPEEFLKAGGQSIDNIADAPVGCAEGFLELSLRAQSRKGPPLALVADPDLPPAESKDGLEKSRLTIDDLFLVMQKRHQEFAFRSMTEMLRFLAVDHELASDGEWDWQRAMDAQILQKILPKLHGSKRKVGSLLAALAKYCEQGVRADAELLLNDETKAEAYLADEDKREITPAFRESYLKLCEMMEVIRRDQFVSFIQ